MDFLAVAPRRLPYALFFCRTFPPGETHVVRAGRWIVATALAWLAGLAVFLAFTMPLWQPGQALALTILIGLAGGLLMAATTAAVTGRALCRLLPR